MDIREAVQKALENEQMGMAVLDSNEQFLSYVMDFMGDDDSQEFNVLSTLYNSGLIEIFSAAAREGTTDALESACARGIDFLTNAQAIDATAAASLCYQMAAGICDHLGIDAPPVPQALAADVTQRRDIFEYPQQPATGSYPQTGFSTTVDVGIGGVPPVGPVPDPWPGTPGAGGTISRPTAVGGYGTTDGWETGQIPPTPPTPPRRTIPTWLIGAGAGAIVALLVAIVVLLTRPQRAYAVPALTSHTLNDALDIIEDSGHFERGKVAYQKSDTVEEGEVISQTPLANESVQDGTRIDLVVSSGPDEAELVEVPSLEGLTAKEAKKTLEELGLVGKQGEDVSDTSIAKDLVAKQSPEEGSEVAKGSTVTYQLSTGKSGDDGAEDIKVPSLVGMSQTEALNALSALGLNGRVGDTITSDIEQGKVASQTPAAGTTVRPGDVVTISPSSGPQTGNPNYTSHAGNVLEHADQDLNGSTLYYRLFTSAYSTKIVARDISTSSSRVIFTEPSGRGLFNILCDGQYVYFGIGNDYDGDELFDSGTIARINLDGSGYRELATEDKFGKFMKFYIMGGRIYYYAGGAVRSIGTDGSGDRAEVQLQDDAEFFCMGGNLYLAEGNKSSFVRIDNGSRTQVYSGATWDDFTVGTTSLILVSKSGSNYSLRWVDLMTGNETGTASCGDVSADNKGITAYGDDLIMLLQYDGGDQQANLYRVSRGGSATSLWSRSGLELVQHPHALGDRIYFSVCASSNSTCTPCSVSIGGGGFRVDESELSHPGL